MLDADINSPRAAFDHLRRGPAPPAVERMLHTVA